MDVIKKSRNAPLPVARLAIMLEPRFMFDAAGVATGAEIIDQTINLAADTETAAPSGDVSELAAALSGGQIAFIDTSVEDYSTLVEGLDSDIEVVLLNGTGDAVAQMADALQGRSNLDAIHIISHGGEGLVVMGQTQLAGDNLEAYQEQLGVIGAALSQDGDILLYGCEIASGAGASFIDSLAGITGADIAASDDRTGHADLGGDWDLEVATGSIESDAPFSERALKDFTHLLSYSGTIDFSNINSAGAYNGTASINASFNVGSYVLVADGQDASTQAYNGSATASGGETRLTFYISGGGTFDVSSLRIYNLAGNGNTITVSSNLGDTHNTASLANDTWTNETLTGFTGITRLYLTGSIDVAFCYVDDMVVANFGAPANSAPTISIDGTPAYTEGGSAVTVDSSVTITDADGVDTDLDDGYLSVSITSGSISSDRLILDTTGSVGLAGTTVSVSGVNVGTLVDSSGTADDGTVNGSDTLRINFNSNITGAYAQTLAQAIQFSNVSDDPGTASRTVTFTINDGTDSGTDTATVSVTEVNDEPTLTATGSNPTFTEGGAAASLFSGTAIDTIESGQNISELIFTVTNVNDGASETISIDGTSVALTDGTSGTTGANSFGYAVSVTGTTATVTITRTDTAANYQTLVNNLAYVNSSDDPNTSNRVVTITSLKDNGGTANSGDDTNATLSVASTVTVTAVNDAPTISNLDGDSVSFSIGGSAVALDSGAALSLSDADSTDFNGGNMTVSITANRQTAEDQLQVVTSGNITVSGTTITHSDSGGVTIGTVSGNNQSTSNLIVTLNANATVARVADLLAALRYYNSDSSTTNTAPRTITITVDDGDGGSSTSSNQNVTINLVRAPIIDLDGDDSTGAANGGYAGAFAEGGGAVALADSDSAISDDGTFRSLTVTLTNRPDGASESLSSTYGTGAQTVNGEAVTITAYNSSTGVLTITVDDGSTSDVTMQMLMESIRYNNSSDDPDTTDRTITFSATDDADNAGSAVNSVISVSGTNDNPTLSGLPSDITVVEDTASNVDLSAATLADVDSSGSNFTLTITAGAGTLAASSGGGVTVTNSGTSAITLTGTVSNIDAFLNTASNIQYTGATNVNGNDATTLTMTANDQDGSGDLNLGTVNVDITAVDDEPTLTATGANPDFVLGGTAVSLFSSTSISTIESGQNITQLVLTVTNISGTGTTEFITLDGTDVALSDGNSGVTGSNAFGYNVALAGGTATVTITKTDTTANYQALVDGMTYSTTLTATDGNDRVATITSLTDNGSNAGANDNVNSTLSVSSTVTLAEQAQDDTSDQGGLNDLSRSEQGANDGFGEEGSGDGSGQNTPTGSSEPFGTDGIVGINTISGLVALEGGLIDPGNIGDPSMGIDTICILRGAVTGNNGALNHYYGSGILSTVGIEDDPVEYPGFEDGGFGGLFGGFGGGLGTGFGGLGSFFQGASNSGLGDSERVLGGQLDEEGAGERMPGMGVPVERGRLGEAMQTEPLNKGGQEVVFGKPAFSRQLANAALEQEDVRWGALAAALGQPGLRDQ